MTHSLESGNLVATHSFTIIQGALGALYPLSFIICLHVIRPQSHPTFIQDLNYGILIYNVNSYIITYMTPNQSVSR